MSSQKALTFIVYLNDLKKADAFKKEILKSEPLSEVLCTNDFDHFYNTIKQKEVDCFFIENNLEQVNSLDIIEKLRKSKKFSRSVIGYYTENNIDLKKEQFSIYRIDFLINDRTSATQFTAELQKAILGYSKKPIPENYQVLVMDDSPEITEIISGHLNEMGHHKINVCHSVKHALDLISTHDFDLMLLDWNLPDGSCIDFIENIRSHSNSERTKNALIVVITGRNDVDDIMTLLKYNVVDHIIKPFDYSEFEDKILYALERKKEK